MFSLMLFMFFFFLGSIAMFIYLLKRLDEQTRALSDEHAQLRVLLRAMESRMEKLAHMKRVADMFQSQLTADGLGQEERAPGDLAGRDPLLHLSFEEPSNPDLNMGQRLDLTPPQKSWDLDGLPEPRQTIR